MTKTLKWASCADSDSLFFLRGVHPRQIRFRGLPPSKLNFFLKKKETDDGILLARAGYVVGWTKERKKGCLALGSVRQTVQLPGRANLSAEPWIPAAFCE